MSIRIVTAVVVTLSTVMVGEAADSFRELEVESTVTTHVIAWGRYSRFRCDSGGNIYLRIWNEDLKSPVTRVSGDGEKVTQFVIPADEDLAGIQDFWVADDGHLYILADKPPDKAYVLSFDADGKHKSSTQLDVPLRANQIAVFDSGDFLIAGRQSVPPEPGAALANGAPFVGIFNDRGQLLKKVEFGKDIKPDPKQPLLRADLHYAEAIVGSATAAGDDGTVYFMRRGIDGPIYAVSAAGLITKTIRLKPPEDAHLATVKIAKGTLAAEFLRKTGDDSRIESILTQLIDIRTGRKITEFKSVPPLGPDFACYSPDEFTFLSNDEKGYLTILRAKGR